MQYKNFWKKVSLFTELPLVKKSGGAFKLFDDAHECLGVSYQTADNWINEAIPQKKTLGKFARALNAAFQTVTPIDEKMLSDETSEMAFARALGAAEQEAKDALLSITMKKDGGHPLDNFWFKDIDLARRTLNRFSGSYEVRTPSSRGHHRSLVVDSISSQSGRHCIVANLTVPSGTDEPFKYDGVVCQRGSLFYWIFRQKEEAAFSDFIFMITDRFDIGRNPAANGTLITMGQKKPIPIMEQISVNRLTTSSKRAPARKA
jgi:hypothetical protein